MDQQLLKGHSKLLILAALHKHPMHGYALSEHLHEEMAEAFKFGVGMLYPILHQLEKDRLIEGRWEEVAGLSKRVYRITKKGRKELSKRKQEWLMMTILIKSMLHPAHI